MNAIMLHGFETSVAVKERKCKQCGMPIRKGENHLALYGTAYHFKVRHNYCALCGVDIADRELKTATGVYKKVLQLQKQSLQTYAKMLDLKGRKLFITFGKSSN